MNAIESAKLKSDAAIAKLRKAAKSYFSPNCVIIVGINGSYARREATQGSDLDLFYLNSSNEPKLSSELDTRIYLAKFTPASSGRH